MKCEYICNLGDLSFKNGPHNFEKSRLDYSSFYNSVADENIVKLILFQVVYFTLIVVCFIFIELSLVE